MQAAAERLFDMIMTPRSGDLPGLGVLEVHGFLDAHAIPDFDRDMQQFVDQGYTRLILDTHDLIYISSAGIGSLVRLTKILARHGGRVVLLPPSDKTAAIFDLLDFTKVLKFAPNEDLALEALYGNDYGKEFGDA